MNNVFYQHQIRNMRYGEIRRMSGGMIEAGVLCALKLVRMPIKVGCGFRFPDDLILIEENALPTHIVDRVNSELDSLRRQSGLSSEFFYKLQTIGPLEIFGWAGLFAQQSTIGVFCVTRYDEQVKVDEKIEFEFQSELEDGRVLVTSMRPNLLDVPEHFEVQWFKNHPHTGLLNQHTDRMVGIGSKPVTLSSKNFESQMLKTLQARTNVLIERKVFVEISEKKLRAFRA